VSYQIVNRIIIENDAVFIGGAPSDLRPLAFTRREEPAYTAVFRAEGIRGLLTLICRELYRGNMRLRSGSMITRAIRRGLHALTLEQFQAMDEADAVQWLVEETQLVLKDWDHDPAADLSYESQPRPENPAVSVRLFGYVELENEMGHFGEGGFDHPLSMELLKYLLAQPERRVDLAELLRWIWPANKQGGEEQSAAILRLRRAREALRPLGLGGVYGLISFRDGVYSLNPAYTLQRDVDEFDVIMEQVTSCPVEDPAGLQLCVRALQLYRGPFLEHSGETKWLAPQRQRYQEAFLTLARSTLARIKQTGEHEALELLCQRAVAIAPEAEKLHRELINYLMAEKMQTLLIRHLYRLSACKAGWLEALRKAKEHDCCREASWEE